VKAWLPEAIAQRYLKSYCQGRKRDSSPTNVVSRNCSLPLRFDVFTQMREETGRKERVQVRDDEGRASHIGPESCASDREVWGEALTGEVMGQVLSHVTKQVRDADTFCVAERNTVGCAIASASPVPRGRRPRHVADTSCTVTGRSHDRSSEKGRSASGRRECTACGFWDTGTNPMPPCR